MYHSLARPRAIMLLMAVMMAAACGGPTAVADRPDAPVVPPVVTPSPITSPPAAPADPAPSPDAPASPEPAAPVVGDPQPAPPAAPEPAAPAKPAVWSKARVVLDGTCAAPVATIDARGDIHVAAACDTRIRYASSTDGRKWRTTMFKRPAHRLEVAPQIAVDGSTLYVAFTRLQPTDGGCGDDGLMDVGVFYRKRQLPAGQWSAPIRIGQIGDRLQSFRVVDGVIHETFISKDGEGPVSYGHLKGKSFRSVRLPGAVSTSLRVGDDGVARIAYSTGHTLRYASVRPDGRLTAKTIFEGRSMQVSSPNLVLGPGDRAYVSWAAHQPWGGGCAEAEQPMPKPGTYFATDAGGSWRVKRLSSHVASASLVIDNASGNVHAVFRDRRSLRHFVRAANGSWTDERVPRSGGMDEAVVRLDPTTGALVLVGSRWVDGEDGSAIVALTLS